MTSETSYLRSFVSVTVRSRTGVRFSFTGQAGNERKRGRFIGDFVRWWRRCKTVGQVKRRPNEDNLMNRLCSSEDTREVKSPGLKMESPDPLSHDHHVTLDIKQEDEEEEVDLRGDRAYHLEHELKCFTCNESFTQRRSLTRHIATMHQQKTHYGCPGCSSKFKRWDNLQAHYRKHHPDAGALSRGCLDESALTPQTGHKPRLEVQAERADVNVRPNDGMFVYSCSIAEMYADHQDSEKGDETGRSDGSSNLGDRQDHQEGLMGAHCSRIQSRMNPDDLDEDQVERSSDESEMDDDRPYECSQCSRTFQNEIELEQHEESCEKLQQSDVFPKDDSQRADKGEDIAPNMNESSATCSVCQKVFACRWNLTVHLRTHTGEKPHSCSICGRSFAQSNNLRVHIDSVHNGNTLKRNWRSATCSICQRVFARQSYLTQHMRTHTGEKPHSCSICGMSFAQGSNLKAHITKIHNGTHSFYCTMCPKGFYRKTYLESHMRTHTGEKPFSCTVCLKSFVQKSSLTYHMNVHTGAGRGSCGVCGKNFAQKRDLDKHMFTHSDEKSFQCSVCQKGFSRKSSLDRHMLKHTGDSSFCCGVCGKTYSRKCDLMTHLKTHTMERPFSCKVCPATFTVANHLKQHKKMHAGE